MTIILLRLTLINEGNFVIIVLFDILTFFQKIIV